MLSVPRRLLDGVAAQFSDGGNDQRGVVVDWLICAQALAPFRTTLRKFSGKCVFELRPSAAWNKGEAALYLLDMVRKAEGGAHDWFDGVQPIYVGDDVTDEDAFKALAPFGAVGVLVAPADESERPARTHATHRLRDVDDVRAFLDALAARAEE